MTELLLAQPTSTINDDHRKGTERADGLRHAEFLHTHKQNDQSRGRWTKSSTLTERTLSGRRWLAPCRCPARKQCTGRGRMITERALEPQYICYSEPMSFPLIDGGSFLTAFTVTTFLLNVLMVSTNQNSCTRA
eukprot:scaffold70798_cov23-Tisochrysis_lutea.AAC.1